MNVISFMSANYVAREADWAMHGWADGDRVTNEAFRPLDAYGDRLGALLADVRAVGFDAIDIWGAHLSPQWATDRHVEIAQRLLAEHRLRVTSYAVWVGSEHLERACEIAAALGAYLIGGHAPVVGDVLERHGVRLALENHPEKTPAELLERAAGDERVGACVDTGWFATQGYDPRRAIEELAGRVFHVHLKDVLAVGEPHETCRWGRGIVDIEGCVRALQAIGYGGAISIEHEPESFDPSDEVRAMREQLLGWLA